MQGCTATAQIRVCNAATPLKSWTFDHAGFLKCKTTVLRSCVLTYSPDELNLENMPAPLRNRDEVKLFVPEEELSRNDVLASLEGRPVSVDHVWQSTMGVDDVGNIAGSPTYDPISKMVFADILVTDPDAIKRITAGEDDPQKLVEQSAGYLMEVDWTPGITENGEAFDGIQRDIQYNHVALVGEGEGRAGKDVRILNKRSCNDMADELVRVKIGDAQIRVHNADVGALEKEMDSKESLIANLINPEELEKFKADTANAHTARDEAVANVEEKDGIIEALRETVDELKDPKRIQNAANQIIKEREDADTIYNSIKGKVDDTALQSAIEQSKSLHGVDLHRHVVTSHRAMNKKPDLSKDQLESAPGLRGRFETLVETSDVVEKTEASGSSLMKTLNAKKAGETKGTHATPEARRKHFHDIQLGKSK